jgi:dynein heavy chain, axonemal
MKEINLFSGKTQVIFSVLLRLDAEDVLYEEVTDKNKLFKTLDDKLTDYNISCSSSKMDLVFFDDAISHICRISRILR